MAFVPNGAPVDQLTDPIDVVRADEMLRKTEQ